MDVFRAEASCLPPKLLPSDKPVYDDPTVIIVHITRPPGPFLISSYDMSESMRARYTDVQT